jgi:peptidoglycan/LPS O-acetylase OafA/YrhL
MQWFNSFIVTGSKISYALYLFHLEILEAFKYLFPSIAEILWLRNIICIILSIAVSQLLYKVIEKKFLILRDKYYPDRLAIKAQPIK